VMGTGIMSIALRLTGHAGLSLALLWVTAALWGVLGVALIARALIDRPRMMRELRTPVALTGIAGTAVLGARLGDHGWTWAPALALMVAGILCPPVILPVVRGIGRTVTGEAFLITVALEALAVLGAIVSEQHRSATLAALALALLIGGVAVYPWVVIRFDREQ
ncbi:MAG TPA: hypothetical protein PKE32_10180, partial [Miltoncostaeaceae bacterium]|nr:hypothetical protein [Miltoncostaeaceae bacterium]